MRVLLTGATGFVGSHLLGSLLRHGDDVRVLALRETVGQVRYRDCVKLIVGSVDDEDVLAEATEGVEVVYHLGGLIPGGNSQAKDFRRVNLLGTQKLLRASEGNSVRRFVFSSSTSVYQEAPVETWPIKEDYSRAANGTNQLQQYARSKIAAENVILRDHRKHGMTYVILRSPTTYGAGVRWAERLVQRLKLRPDKLRLPATKVVGLQWVHVKDIARALALAGTRPRAANQIFNIAGDELFSFADLCRVVRRISANGSRPGRFHQPLSNRGLALRYDLTKARHLLGYASQVRLEEGFREVIAGRRAPRYQA